MMTPSLAGKAEPSPAEALGMLQVMWRIRRCEEQVVRAYAGGDIPGGCHTYIGEEAVGAGVIAHLRTDDAVFSTHRGHGHALAKGLAPRRMLAEVFGKSTGCSGGRGGSMHLFEPEVGFYGSSGIVGPSITMATGMAYAFRLAGSDRVAVAFFGDGASNNGSFHEGINLAGAWDLPVLFVCENNQYATEVPFRGISRSPSVASRGAGYGIPGIEVDGNDALAVWEVAREAVARARAGNGPTLIECHTYRTRAHSEGMRDTGYRTQEEVDSWKQRDPIVLLEKALLESGYATQAELDAAQAQAKQEAEEGAEFARQSPWPDPSTLTQHLYAEEGASHA
ncbi:MAG: thiamine pyrophosphate-dependent dehydrogenase E1 component subunit alpha [Anaerolineae bacterium]